MILPSTSREGGKGKKERKKDSPGERVIIERQARRRTCFRMNSHYRIVGEGGGAREGCATVVILGVATTVFALGRCTYCTKKTWRNREMSKGFFVDRMDNGGEYDSPTVTR